MPVTTEASERQFALFIVTVVTWSVFGPYIGGGLRTEQIAVYLCALGAVVLCSGVVRTTGSSILSIATYLIMLAVAIFGAVSRPVATGAEAAFPPGQVFAGIDNLALPIAVLVLSQALVIRPGIRVVLLNRVCGIVVLAMVINTLLAFASGQVNLTNYLSKFWDSGTADASTDSVAGRAAQLGRLTGIINQPSEAGVMYAVALFAAIYLYRDRARRLALVSVILTVGGILTVSKLFILVAVPIAAVQIVRLRGGRGRRLVAFGTVLIVAAGASQAGWLPKWTGSEYLNRLASPTGGFVRFYSAGRFGSDSSFGAVARAVWNTSPVAGVGAGGLATAYDNAWIEGLVYAGIFGIVGYTLALLIPSVAWRRRRGTGVPGESTLAGSIAVVVIVGSLGLPVLTGNRVATVVWLIFGLTVLGRSTPESDRVPVARPQRKPKVRPVMPEPRATVALESIRPQTAAVRYSDWPAATISQDRDPQRSPG